MASIRDYAITINSTATASMVCEMPTHETGDLLVAFVNKDTNTSFTTPANWNAIRVVNSAGAAGGVYTKVAASSSETVTFALTIETCNAVIISVKNVEVQIDSGAGALTINVVAAGLTFTRTTGSFTTDGFTVGQTVIMSGFTNAGNNGPKEIVSITGSGTILTVTSASALVNETGNNNERVISTGLDKSAGSGADDSTLPFAGIGLTPVANNTLILHGLSTDTGMGANALPPWINLFAGDAGANSLCVSRTQQKTAAAITAPNHWGGAADDTRGVIIAIRDNGNGDTFDAYLPLSTTPATQVSPLNGSTGVVDKGAYIAAASIVITTVAGKTVTGVTVGTTADSGINPFRGSMLTVGASSTTNLAHTEFDLTATVDLTAGQGLLFGTYGNTAPRDYVDTGKAVQGGKYLLVGSTTANYKAWVVGGQFTKTERADARNNYLIEVASSDTIYASAGTANMAAADYFAFGSAGYYGAASVRWNEMYLLSVFELAGGGTTPFNFDEIVFAVNNGGGILPLMQQTGASALVWCPLKFGGTEATHVGCNLNAFQFPQKADEIDYVDFHVSNNKIGIEFDGQDRGSGDVDTLTFTNCVFTSPSSYYWRFASTHDAGATVNMSGASVVNANVTLRSTVSLSTVSFIDCTTFTQNNAALDGCTFDTTKIISDNPADISNGIFVQGGNDTGHGIEITAAGTYSFTGNTFDADFGPNVFGFHTTNDVNATTDVVTEVSHGYATGDAIEYRKQGGSAAIGLTDATTYYVRAVSADTIAFYTSQANAIADTSRIALTSTGTDTHYINSLKAAIYNNSAGAVTLNITDGDTPTIRNGAGATTTINNAVTLTVTVKDSLGAAIQNARVAIFTDDTGEVELMNELTTALGVATESYGYSSDISVFIRVRCASGSPAYQDVETSGLITSDGLNAQITMQVDTNV